MMPTELDLDLLETFLDGQFSPSEADALRQRLAAEPGLAAALDQLTADRDLRLSVFTDMEGDDAALLRVNQSLDRAIAADRHRSFVLRSIRYIMAAAACLVIGFLAAHLRNTPRPIASKPSASGPALYNVSLADESGRILATQKFESLEKAREFSEDLQRSEDRLERLRTGMVTIRSTDF